MQNKPNPCWNRVLHGKASCSWHENAHFMLGTWVWISCTRIVFPCRARNFVRAVLHESYLKAAYWSTRVLRVPGTGTKVLRILVNHTRVFHNNANNKMEEPSIACDTDKENFTYNDNYMDIRGTIRGSSYVKWLGHCHTCVQYHLRRLYLQAHILVIDQINL